MNPGDAEYLASLKARKTPVSHSIITPACRQGRGDFGAFEEAVARARREYQAIVEGWKDAEQQPTLHLVLSMERP